ncbi:CBS domain-containing protein [Neptunicella marina]|uniref:CBS domain-containing protein n=1 Tax=Neptunicella marina TaxID=2125989 RepID=A0A8J6M093_9ALTE|nr:CBS domain-containing protein [Neptunicella marina]MBC3764438.1 CBS domain-containing protein [Neptunicella marina]
MKVHELMTKRVVTVEMDDRLDVVYEIFRKSNFHHLLVVADKKLLGVLTDKDLFRAISPRIGTNMQNEHDLASLNKRVHQIMSRQLITINQDQGVIEAIKLFNAKNVSCLPVLNNEQEWVGILSWRDILKHIELLKGQAVVKK